MHRHTALLYGRNYNASSRHRSECRELPVRIIRIREAFGTLFRASFQEHDLTDPQWRVLRVLSAVDEIDTAALASRAILLGPSLSRILRDLDHRGLIQRRSSKVDARRSLHSLTSQGRELIDKIVPYFDPIYQILADKIDEEDVIQLGGLLDNLLKTLDDIIADRSE